MPDRWDRKHRRRRRRPPAAITVDKNVNRADTSQHVVLVPGEPRGKTVRWYCEKDGSAQAREYFEATPKCRGALVAIARQIAAVGHVGKVPERGHALHGEFSDLYVLKPDGHRFIGWFHAQSFYIAVGAKKDPKRQDVDYRAAQQKHTLFLESLR